MNIITVIACCNQSSCSLNVKISTFISMFIKVIFLFSFIYNVAMLDVQIELPQIQIMR